MTRVKTIIPSVLFAVVGIVGAQDALTIDPTGNVGINNSSPTEQLDVDGNIRSTGTIDAANIRVLEASGVGVFTGMVLIEDTFATRAEVNKYIALPSGFTPEDTFILTAKISRPDGIVQHSLPLSSPNADLRVGFLNEMIWMKNRWSNEDYDNWRVQIILAKVGS